MPLVDSRPLTPGQRFLTRNKQEVSKKKPERRLVTRIHDKQGRMLRTVQLISPSLPTQMVKSATYSHHAVS